MTGDEMQRIGRLGLSVLVLLLIFPLTTIAQFFPINSTVSVTSPSLPSYMHQWLPVGSSYSPFRITLQFNDLNDRPIDVQLSLLIEGEGVRLASDPNRPVMLRLDPGEFRSLDDVALSELFSADRLSLSNGLLGQTALPEGIYTVCLQVRDLIRGSPLANEACAVLTVQDFPVPEWQMIQPASELPTDAFTLGRIDVNQRSALMFTWAPRHPPLFMAEYDLEVFEYPTGSGLSYDQVVNHSIPLFKTTTTSTSYWYQPLDPPLQIHETYLLRLTARDMDGVYHFANNGIGPVESFQLFEPSDDAVDICLDPEAQPYLQLTDRDGLWAAMAWTLHEELTSETAILFARDDYGDWQEIDQTEASASTVALELDPTWTRARIGIPCPGGGDLIFSNTVSLVAFPEVGPDCSGQSSQVESTSPLPFQLERGDSALVGDFVLVLNDLRSREDGIYDGFGYISMPLFGQIRPRVAVSYNGLQFNDRYQMIGGVVQTIYDEQDNSLYSFNDIAALMQSWQPIDNVSYNEVVTTEGNVTGIQIDTDGDTQILVVDADGQVTITTYPINRTPPPDLAEDFRRDGYSVAGDVFLPEQTSASTFTGPDGKEYGRIGDAIYEQSDQLDPVLTKTMGELGEVIFAAHPESKGGYDPPYDHALGDYMPLGEDYRMGWKAIRFSTSDVVQVDISRSQADQHWFESLSGYSLQYDDPGLESRIKLQVPGRNDGDREAIYALGNTLSDTTLQSLGGFKVVSYPLRQLTLNVIPINGASVPIDQDRLARDLNRIYNPAIVTWQVKILDNIDIDYDEGTPDGALATGKGTTDQFNPELRNVADGLGDLLEEGTKELPVFTIVVVDRLEAEYVGYMPRGRSLGFVQASATNFSRLVAHELGHGAFGLRHTWEEFPETEEGETNNLMDYSSGTNLIKRQWDQIHRPLKVWGLFETSEGAGQIGEPVYFCIQGETLESFPHRCFMTPDGQSITLSEYELTQLAFYAIEDKDPDIRGRLASFVANGKTYSAKLNEDGRFAAYHNYADTTELFTISACNSAPTKVLGSIESCEYTINDELYTKASLCNCNDPKERQEIDVFDGFVSFTGSSYQEFIDETEELKNQGLSEDTEELLSSLSQEKYLISNVKVSEKLDYINEWLNDKFIYLESRTGVRYYVVTQLLDYVLSEPEVRDLAQKIYNSAEIQSQNSLLFFVPLFYDEGYVDNILNVKGRFLANPYLHDPNNLAQGTFESSQDLLDVILSVYRNIPKPYNQYLLKVLPGETGYFEVQENENAFVTGHNMINDLLALHHEDISEFDESLADALRLENLLSREGLNVNDFPALVKILNEWSTERERIVNVAYSQRDQLDRFEKHRPLDIKESAIPEYFQLYFEKYVEGGLAEGYRISKGESALPSNVLYTFDFSRVLFDRAVYPTLEAAAFVPVLGGIPDAVGLALASYQGDVVRVAEFGAGLALQFVVGGKIIEAGLSTAVRRAVLSVNEGLIIDLQKATVRELQTFFESQATLSARRAQSLAQAVIDNPEKADLLCNSITTRSLRRASSDAEFDDLLRALVDGTSTFLPNVQRLLEASSDDVVDFITNLDEAVLEQLERDLDVILEELLERPKLVKAWDLLKATPLRLDVDGWLFRVAKWGDAGIEVGFVENGGVVELFAGGSNPFTSGLKIGELIEEQGTYVMDLFADGFIPLQSPSAGSILNSTVLDFAVYRPCGDPIIGASLVRTSDAAVGIVEDVSGYASAIIRDALSAPNHKLRSSLLARGLVKVGEQAHHVIPIELLQKNSVVQDAVEAGFDFNGIINGKGLRSAGGSPIHRGAHRKYTDGVEALITERVNPMIQAGDYSRSRAKSILEDLSTELKELMDEFPNKPVNTLFS